MVTNQDGLGSPSFPEENFYPVHDLVVKTFANEGVEFAAEHIDRSFPQDNSPNRKPRTGLLQKYFSEDYDLAGSYVIGDRMTDMELARNLGAQGIFINSQRSYFGQVFPTYTKRACCKDTPLIIVVFDYIKIPQVIIHIT